MSTATITTVTPYAAHRLVNKALEDAGSAHRIPPQMMYNYTTTRLNQDKTPLIKCDGTKIVVEGEGGLNEWIVNYVAKKTTKKTTEEPVVEAEAAQA